MARKFVSLENPQGLIFERSPVSNESTIWDDYFIITVKWSATVVQLAAYARTMECNQGTKLKSYALANVC